MVMAALNTPLFKHLTADGAVTTDNKAGVLHYCIFTGETVADKLLIKDGASTIFTLVTSVAWQPVIIDFLGKDVARPEFLTDIDADFTLNTSGSATFIYVEIQE